MDTTPEKSIPTEEALPRLPPSALEQVGGSPDYVQKESLVEPLEGGAPSVTPNPAVPAAVAPSPVIDPEIAQVEKILEEDLGDVYMKLSPEKQEEFRKKGEQTAHVVVILLRSLHIRIGKIVGAILGWLKILPGVSKYYLEQEAKIKTERILSARSKMQ